MLLKSSDGRFAPVRCGRNSCVYCYRLKSFERAQAIYEDACVEAPTYGITLTTRAATWDGAAYREGTRRVRAALRRKYGRAEMCELIEQTTGKAPRSGGRRRGHGHNLVKGIPAGEVLQLERLIVPIWRRAVGAWHVNVSELRSAGGAVAYLTLNLAFEKHKERQMPTGLPAKTRTLRNTRGYWTLDKAEAFRRSREHNAKRRLAWRLRREGVPGDVLDLAVQAAWQDECDRTWKLVEVKRLPGTVVFEPGRALQRDKEVQWPTSPTGT